MNADQVTGIARAILPAIIAYVVGKGWIPAGAAADAGAAILAIVAAIWSVYNNKTGKTIA